ncbi:MAG: hypothetical protein ACOCVP_08400, partial [Wenzhouxiangella sp.]
MKQTLFYFPIAVLAWLLVASLPVRAEFQADIETVLALGPLPLAAEQLDDSAKADAIHRALIMQLSESGPPAPQARVRVFGQPLSWQAVSPSALAAKAGVAVWMVHLDAERFVRGHLVVSGLAAPEVWLDGRPHAPEEGRVELNLAAGTHTLWLVHHGVDDEQPPALQWTGRSDLDRVGFHVQPQLKVSARRLTNAETANELAISPDGQSLAITFSARSDSADLDLSRLEIRTLADNRIVRQWTSSPPRSLAWSPDSDRLAVHEGDNLWLHDLDSGRARLLLAEHERIGDWRWHPDGESILFAWTEPFEADNDQRRRLRSLEDRWASFRDSTQLYQVDIESGLIRPLTTGPASVNLLDVHPNGDRLLLSERIIDYAEPPHSLFRLYTLSLPSLETREIGQYRQINAALFAEQGYWLLAGPGLA